VEAQAANEILKGQQLLWNLRSSHSTPLPCPSIPSTFHVAKTCPYTCKQQKIFKGQKLKNSVDITWFLESHQNMQNIGKSEDILNNNRKALKTEFLHLKKSVNQTRSIYPVPKFKFDSNNDLCKSLMPPQDLKIPSGSSSTQRSSTVPLHCMGHRTDAGAHSTSSRQQR
jgi:hypothetical protein